MKRIGLIALALVLALGGLGVGFAQWTETLNINGDVDTAELCAIFRNAVSNDDGQLGPRLFTDGAWFDVVDPGDNGDDPVACQKMGDLVSRPNGNVASTTVAGAHPQGHEFTFPIGDPTDYQALTVTMDNVYPSYSSTIFFTVMNACDLPAKVQKVELTMVSKKGVEFILGCGPLELVVCNTYYVHFIQDPTTGLPTSAWVDQDPAGAHYSIHLSNDEGTLYGVMGGPFQNIDSAAGNICIHIEDEAEENVCYDFTVKITVVPFNVTP